MRNGGDDEAQALDGAARFARQTNDQRFIDHHRQVARKDGVLRDFHGLGAHNFAEARQKCGI